MNIDKRPVIKIHPILFLIVDYFESTIEAERITKLDRRNIISSCNKIVNQCGGFLFRFLDEFTSDFNLFFEKASFLKNDKFDIIKSIKLGAYLWKNYNYFNIPNYHLSEYIDGKEIHEKWKFIPNTNNLYKVSSFGRLLSYRNYPFISLRNINACGNDYLITPLYLNNGIFYSRMHQLVAKTFIPNPNNLPQINHKNEIKWDNRVNNLEWCDQTYNNIFNNRHLKVAAKKSLPVDSFDNETGKFVKHYESIKDASIECGVTATAIVSAIKGRTKKAANLKWKYANQKG